MDALLFVLWHRYTNNLKKAFSKPLSAILTVLTMIGIPGAMIAAFVMPNKGIGANTSVVIACVVLGMGLLILNAVLSSAQSAIYTLQDANLLFKAPLSKGNVMMYAVLDVIPASLLTALFFTFYFPFLIGDIMGAGDYFLVLLFSGLMIAFVYLIFYLIYIWDIKRPGVRRASKYVLWGLMGIAVAAFAWVLHAQGGSFSKAAGAFFSGSVYRAVPVFGWVQWGIESALSRQYLSGCLPAGLLLLGSNALLVWAMLRTDVDFYEKALSDSYKVNEILDSVKNDSFDARSTVKVSKRAVHAEFKPGAAALLSRQLLEMKKTSSLIFLRDFIGGTVYIGMAKLMDLGFIFAFGMLLFMSLSAAGNDNWNKDFRKPYVYLIPESSFLKVMYSVLPGIVRSMFIGVITVTAAGLAFSVPAGDMIAYVLINISFAFVFILAEVLSYRVMRGAKNPIVLSFFRMFFALAAAVPAGIMIGIFFVLFPGAAGLLTTAVVLLITNLLVALLMAYLSRRLFECSELY